MNRNSKITDKIAKRLGDGTDTRKLERWSQERLGPVESLSEEETYLHFKAVKEWVGRTHDYDTAALLLATRKIACLRLRDVYVRVHIGEDFDEYCNRDPDSNESDFALAEDLAEQWAVGLTSLPSNIRPMVDQGLEQLADVSGVLGESSETVVGSLLTQIAVSTLGGSVFNPAVLVAFAGDDPSSFLMPTSKKEDSTESMLSPSGSSMAEVMDTWNRIDLLELKEFITKASFSDLIDAVCDSKEKLEWMVANNHLSMDDAAVEYNSALAAPIFHVMHKDIEIKLSATYERLGISDPSELFPKEPGES